MMTLFWLAQQSATGRGLTVMPESLENIFGGAVLFFVLIMVFTGKIRLEREIKAKEELIEIQDRTLAQQQQTIESITQQDRETLRILRDLRDVAIRRGEIKKD